VNGDISDLDAFHEALANVEFEAAYGPITLDDNRQAISNNYVKRVVPDADGDGVPEVQTFLRIPDVDQSFGGTFTPDSPPPDRSNPPCEQRDIPWVGQAEEVNFSQGGQAAQKE
jgi:branched-chain amino acid transport system substrate-binding protein